MADVSDDVPTVTLGDHLRNLPQYLWPQRLLTRLTYRLTRNEWPWFKNALIRAFIRHFQVDMEQALQKDVQAYPHFNAFFTRALKPDARPVAAGEGVICCPVDGAVSQMGMATEDTLLQAKGQRFSVTALLGGDPQRAAPFQGGAFATLYLSPRDYHRIHMPLTGSLREMVHIPGRLFSVSPLTTRMISHLFAKNERLVTVFDTALGPMAVVLVGAINVASIETVWAGVITPPLAETQRGWRYPSSTTERVQLDKGQELGRFNMGSTVILLFGRTKVIWESAMQTGTAVRMGQRLGQAVD